MRKTVALAMRVIHRVVFFCVLFSCLSISAENNKVIFLLSTPRTLSTAFVRMMVNRDDFIAYSEPAMAMYFKRHHPEVDFKFTSSAIWSFSQMQKNFERDRSKKHLFIKEFGSRLWPLFEENSAYFEDPDCYFVFLIRSPHKVAISLYIGLKKMSDGKIDEANLTDLVMHEELWGIYKKIKQRVKNSPILIFSDDLSNHPIKTVQAFCEKTGIKFLEKHLVWNTFDIANQEVPQWNETKQYSDILVWNENVLKSVGFTPQKKYKVDDLGEPTFEEVQNQFDREIVRRAYLRQLPFYKFFLLEVGDQRN